MVLIDEVRPRRWWEHLLFNQCGAVLARHPGRNTDAVVCRPRSPLGAERVPTV
jgi:hypothetical protein